MSFFSHEKELRPLMQGAEETRQRFPQPYRSWSPLHCSLGPCFLAGILAPPLSCLGTAFSAYCTPGWPSPSLHCWLYSGESEASDREVRGCSTDKQGYTYRKIINKPVWIKTQAFQVIHRHKQRDAATFFSVAMTSVFFWRRWLVTGTEPKSSNACKQRLMSWVGGEAVRQTHILQCSRAFIEDKEKKKCRKLWLKVT
uniref:Uncharacterized protein n=1 Tax=Paramormyrops kingsleyae TaxID=1676925 RepID=A0A3B3S611_9TELE